MANREDRSIDRNRWKKKDRQLYGLWQWTQLWRPSPSWKPKQKDRAGLIDKKFYKIDGLR